VRAGEVLIRIVESQGIFKILKLLGEAISSPGESPHIHFHSQVLTLYIASIDLLNIRFALND